MKCTSCKDPYINADEFCKHQCDDVIACRNSGECIADNEGVRVPISYIGTIMSYNCKLKQLSRPRPASVPRTLGHQDVKVVWNHTFIQNMDVEISVTSQVGTKLLIGNINAVMVGNVLIQAISPPMKLDTIACALFNTEVSVQNYNSLERHIEIMSIYYRIFMWSTEIMWWR